MGVVHNVLEHLANCGFVSYCILFIGLGMSLFSMGMGNNGVQQHNRKLYNNNTNIIQV